MGLSSLHLELLLKKALARSDKLSLHGILHWYRPFNFVKCGFKGITAKCLLHFQYGGTLYINCFILEVVPLGFQILLPHCNIKGFLILSCQLNRSSEAFLSFKWHKMLRFEFLSKLLHCCMIFISVSCFESLRSRSLLCDQALNSKHESRENYLAGDLKVHKYVYLWMDLSCALKASFMTCVT